MRERGLDSRPWIKLLQNGAEDTRKERTTRAQCKTNRLWKTSPKISVSGDFCRSAKTRQIFSFELRCTCHEWTFSQAPYWYYYQVPDLCPQCRLFPRRTWCRCLHTSWAMGCAHHQTLGGRTRSLKKHESFPWTVQNDSQRTTDEELRSSPRNWRERRTEREKKQRQRWWKEVESEEEEYQGKILHGHRGQCWSKKGNFSQLFLLGGIRKFDGVYHSMVSKDWEGQIYLFNKCKRQSL